MNLLIIYKETSLTGRNFAFVHSLLKMEGGTKALKENISFDT